MLGHGNQRRVIALVGLAAYVIAAFGFLPSPSLVQNLLRIHGAERFPCESHACGCVDAESCRTDCCCYSPSEIAAWAESNNLDPVGWVVLDSGPSELQQDAEEPMPDDCPLCSLSEEDPTAQDASATAGIELPRIAPLGCKQIGQWLLLTLPITTRPALADRIATNPMLREAPSEVQERIPALTALEIPDPPPRSA